MQPEKFIRINGAEGVPFSIIETNPTKVMTNNGDMESGLVILLQTTGEVKNPRIYAAACGY